MTFDQPVKNVSAPLNFDTVTTLTRMADDRSYRLDVRGRVGNSLGRTEAAARSPGNVLGINSNPFGLFPDGNLEIDSGTFVASYLASNSNILVKSGSGVTEEGSTAVESGSWVTGSTSTRPHVRRGLTAAH